MSKKATLNEKPEEEVEAEMTCDIVHLLVI